MPTRLIKYFELFCRFTGFEKRREARSGENEGPRPQSFHAFPLSHGEVSLLFFVTVFLVALFCNCAFAADWSFTPSVTLSEKYDSNIDFSSTSAPGVPKGDFITSLEPVFSLMGQTEQTIFKLDTDTTGEKYVENPSFDTINTNTFTSLTELWSPRFSTDANFRFIHDYTLDQLQTTGIVVQNVERYQYDAGGGVKYALSQTLNLTASGSYSYTTYPSHPEGLPDSYVYQATLKPVWSIDPLDDIGLSSNFMEENYPSFSTDINTITEMLYWKRRLSETMNLDLGVGYYFTWSSFVTQVIRFIPPASPVLVIKPGSGSESDPAAEVNLRKEWSEGFSTTFLASKSQYNDPYARSFDLTSVGFTASYRLSELTTAHFSAIYNRNDQTSQGNEKIDYVNIGPSIERRISENLTARLLGSYELEMYNTGSPGVNIDRCSVWIELTYKWPRFWATD